MGTAQYLRDERLYLPTTLHVTSLGRYTDVTAVQFMTTPQYTSAAWPANNRAVYYPLQIPGYFTVARFMLGNGASVSGNVDIGLYDAAGSRLISTGSTAQSGTTQVQYIGVTDKSFPPGKYYLALSCSTTSARVNASSAVSQYDFRAAGLLQESLGSVTLPTTMTPASYTSNLGFFFGFTQSDTL